MKDILASKSFEIKKAEKHNLHYINKKYKNIEEDGLPRVGQKVNNGEIYINKKTPVITQ